MCLSYNRKTCPFPCSFLVPFSKWIGPCHNKLNKLGLDRKEGGGWFERTHNLCKMSFCGRKMGTEREQQKDYCSKYLSLLFLVWTHFGSNSRVTTLFLNTISLLPTRFAPRLHLIPSEYLTASPFPVVWSPILTPQAFVLPPSLTWLQVWSFPARKWAFSSIYLGMCTEWADSYIRK